MSDLPVCRGGEAELLSCFEIENFSSPQVQAQLRAGLGMCPAHARRLFDHVGEGHIMTIVMREALTGARAYVKDDAQPGSCPTCEAAASGSRRASQLVTDGLRDPAMVRLDSQHQGMCLVHVL